MTAPIAATIMTGFLGSGKTTLLNELLHSAHGLRLAVIVNEFGSVGVDGALVAGGEQFVELDNGCLCCALNEDLKQTLQTLSARGGFDHVVVETTGMADPLPVAWAFTRPAVSNVYRVDAIVTVVDAANVQGAMQQASEVSLQIQRADILLLNKLDLVGDHGAAAEELLRSLNAAAPIVRRRPGTELPWDMLLSQGAGTTSSPPHQVHQSSFESWSFETSQRVSDRGLEDLVYSVPTNVYRMKGLLRTDAEWDWTLVNAVAGRIDLRPIVPSRVPARSGMVFIGKDLDRTVLATLCAKIVL